MKICGRTKRPCQIKRSGRRCNLRPAQICKKPGSARRSMGAPPRGSQVTLLLRPSFPLGATLCMSATFAAERREEVPTRRVGTSRLMWERIAFAMMRLRSGSVFAVANRSHKVSGQDCQSSTSLTERSRFDRHPHPLPCGRSHIHKLPSN